MQNYNITLKDTTMKGINYLAAFIGGAAVGVACGILFAPEKGSDTRAKIIEAIKKRGIKLSHKEMEDLASDIAEDLGIGANE
jgi:gas vesicle protein